MTVLEELARALAVFDDGALAALASPGLLARARKDLRREPPRIEAEGGGWLRVRTGVETARLKVPPSESTCSCPSGTLCRHALAALLFVRESAAASGAGAAAPLAELLAVSDGALAAYAGRPLLRRAARAVARGLEVEVEDQDAVPLVLRLPALNVTCRFLPGQGLAGMLCSCAAQPACEHRVAAVLALQAERGGRALALEEEALASSAGAPRSRDEVLGAVRQVLAEALVTGLVRLSRATAARLETLAMSAHGVDLPRLSRELDALASGARGLLDRQAGAGPGRFMADAARAWALTRGLQRQPTSHEAVPSAPRGSPPPSLRRPELVGEHRSAYVPVGELVLHGLGARGFRTPSGFVGLRLVFWDETSRRLAAWTDARPEDTVGFDPVARFTAPGPWTGCPSPDTACRSRFRLAGAQRNARGRLSGREASVFTALGPARPLSLPVAVEDFAALEDAAFRLFGRGLGARRELEDVVLLKTASWGPPSFDPVRQELTREVRDAAGRRLTVSVPHLAESARAVAVVEKARGLTGLLGQLRLSRGRLVVQPIALYQGETIRCPSLERGAEPSSEAPEDGAAEEVAAGSAELPRSAAGRAVAALEGALEALAEAGLSAPAPGLRDAVARAERLGLTAAAAAARALETRLGTADPLAAAEELMRAAYVARLTAEAETVRLACASLKAG